MSDIESKLVMGEKVENTEHKFGEQKWYFPTKIKLDSGDEVNALFTKDQIDVAIARAERNPEDIPKDESFWSFLFRNQGTLTDV